MNLRGNTFSLGEGRLVSGVMRDGICHIFMRRAGPIAYVQFDPTERTLCTISGKASYGDFCGLIEGNLTEYIDGQVRRL